MRVEGAIGGILFLVLVMIFSSKRNCEPGELMLCCLINICPSNHSSKKVSVSIHPFIHLRVHLLIHRYIPSSVSFQNINNAASVTG